MNHGQIIDISGKKYYFRYDNLPISFELVDISNPTDFRLICRLDRRSVPIRESKESTLVFSYVVPSSMREKNWLLGFSQGPSHEIDSMPPAHKASLVPEHWFFFSPFTSKWTPIDMAMEWKSMENSIDFFRRPDLKHSLQHMNAMIPLWVHGPLALQGLLAWSSEPCLYFLSVDKKRSNIFILDDNSGISYVEALGDRLVFVGRSDGTFDVLFFDDFRRTPFHAFNELRPPTDNPVSFMKLVHGPAHSYLLIGHCTTERDIRAFLSIYEIPNACFAATEYRQHDFQFEKIGQTSIYDPSLTFEVLADGVATESEFILAALFKSPSPESSSVLHTYRVENVDIHNPSVSDVLQSIASLEGDFSKALDVYLDPELQVIFLSDDGPKRVMDLKREDRSYYNLWSRWFQPAVRQSNQSARACAHTQHEFYARVICEIPGLPETMSLSMPEDESSWHASIQAVQSNLAASAMSKELVYFYWFLELSPEVASRFAQSGQLLPEFYDMVRVFWNLDHSKNLDQIFPLLQQASSLDISPHCRLSILTKLTALGMVEEAIEYAQMASIYTLPPIHQENLKEAFNHAKLILKLHLSQKEILNAFGYYRSVLGQLDSVDSNSYHIVKEELFLLILGAVLDPPDRITPEGITISPVETDDSMRKRETLLSQVPLDASEKNMLCKYCIQYSPNERNHDFLLAYYIAKGEIFEAMLFYKNSKCFPRYLQSCSSSLRKRLSDDELKAIIKRYEKRDGYLYAIREELPLHLTKELELYYHGSKALDEIESTHKIEVPIGSFIEAAANADPLLSEPVSASVKENEDALLPHKTLQHVRQALARVVSSTIDSPLSLAARTNRPLINTPLPSSSSSSPSIAAITSASPTVHRVKVESLPRSPLKRSVHDPKSAERKQVSSSISSPQMLAERKESLVGSAREPQSASPRTRKSLSSAMELSPQRPIGSSEHAHHRPSPLEKARMDTSQLSKQGEASDRHSQRPTMELAEEVSRQVKQVAKSPADKSLPHPSKAVEGDSDSDVAMGMEERHGLATTNIVSEPSSTLTRSSPRQKRSAASADRTSEAGPRRKSLPGSDSSPTHSDSSPIRSKRGRSATRSRSRSSSQKNMLPQKSPQNQSQSRTVPTRSHEAMQNDKKTASSPSQRTATLSPVRENESQAVNLLPKMSKSPRRQVLTKSPARQSSVNDSRSESSTDRLSSVSFSPKATLRTSPKATLRTSPKATLRTSPKAKSLELASANVSNASQKDSQNTNSTGAASSPKQGKSDPTTGLNLKQVNDNSSPRKTSTKSNSSPLATQKAKTASSPLRKGRKALSSSKAAVSPSRTSPRARSSPKAKSSPVPPSPRKIAASPSLTMTPTIRKSGSPKTNATAVDKSMSMSMSMSKTVAKTPRDVATPVKDSMAKVEGSSSKVRNQTLAKRKNTLSSPALKTPRSTAQRTATPRQKSDLSTVKDLTEPLRTTPKKSVRRGTPRKPSSAVKVSKRKRPVVEADQQIGATPRVVKRVRAAEKQNEPQAQAPESQSLLVAPSPLMSNITRRAGRKSKAVPADLRSSPVRTAIISASSPTRSHSAARLLSPSKSSPSRTRRHPSTLDAAAEHSNNTSPSGHVYDLRDRPVHAPESLTFTFPVHPHHHASHPHPSDA